MPATKESIANMPGGPAIVRELALAQGPKAFERLVELLASKDERLVLSVAQEILNRAYGKADSGRESREEDNRPTVVVIRGEERFNENKALSASEEKPAKSGKKRALSGPSVLPAQRSSRRGRVSAQ